MQADLPQPNDIQVLVFFKGRERYIFLWKQQDAVEVFRTFGRFASDDAAGLCGYVARAVVNT